MKFKINLLRLFAIFVLLLCLPINPVQAKADLPSLAILEIDLRPEFDQPGVLVAYHLVLSSDTRLPTTLTVRIPQHAGNPSQVSWVDPTDGNMTTIPYQLVLDGDWNAVTFTTSAYEINFEYYDPLLVVKENQHSFEYTWNGDYAVTDLSIYIQQPVGASEMTIAPSLGSPKQGDNNIIYYYARLGEVEKNTPFKIQIKYSKSNQNLSVEQLQVQPSGDLGESTPGRTSLRELMPWLIVILVILLILAILWWIWLANYSATPSRNIKTLRDVITQKGLNSNTEALYCRNCGYRADTKDVFCRVCGSKLKEDE